MSQNEPTPKSFQAVIHPEKFLPFSLMTTQEEFERFWEENRAFVLANLCHTVYHPQKRVLSLMKKFGARKTRFYDRKGAQAFLAVWSDKAVLLFRGTQVSEKKTFPVAILTDVEHFIERVFKHKLPQEYMSFLSNDILADLLFGMTSLDGAEVHKGFLREFRKLWKMLILPDLQRLTKPNNIPVSVTGHSLGGAMATIAGMHEKFFEVVTFGEPRVGHHISKAFQARKHLRYVNGHDPIPKVPPTWWPFSYKHHGGKRKVTDPEEPNAVYDHSIIYYANNLA